MKPVALLMFAFSTVVLPQTETGTASNQAPAASDGAKICQPPPSMLALIRHPLVVQAVHRRIAGQPTTMAPDGASKLSREWVEGKRKDWFIDNQRDGGDLIEAGVVLGDHKLVDNGLRELEWGYARQSQDGSFPETGDAFHGVSTYVLDTARALLVLRDRREEFAEFIPRLEKMIPHVGAAAEWLLQPAVLEPGKRRDQPYTHRKWMLAAALGEAGQLSGNARLAVAATNFAAEGIVLQHEDGENPEKDGFDVSYQMVDALNGARYYTTLNCQTSADLMSRVRRMIERTCRWEMRRILATGEIDVTGSTRMLKEPARSGDIKHTNYKEVVEAFSFAAAITGDSLYAQTAERLARFQGWVPR
jgi:hypothetical protein